MDFWGCDSKRYVHELLSEDDELDLGVDGGLDGSENMLFEFDFDRPFGLEEDDALLLDKQVMERFQEVESGFSDVIQKLNENENSLNVEILGVGDGIFSGDDMNLASPDCGLSSFSLLEENENESWSGNSSYSALNLDRVRQGENENDEISEKRLEDSAVDLSVLDKQANFESLSSTKVTCQVHGCNADLTSSKDYYKRHRVCPLDTKKAEVIVNGIQKRFCQQCSRFHLLNEFDEDKRSCRKRLAGHNKRRRKPRFENLLNRPHRFQPYQSQETRPQGAVLPPKRHLLTDQLPARVLFPDIYEQINGSRLQGSSVYRPTPMSNNIPTLRNPCHGPEYYTPQVSSSTVQKPSGVIDASYALSLLSNQPQFSPTYFSPVIIQGHNVFHNPASPHMLHSSGMNLIQAYQIHPSMVHGTMNPVNSMFTGGHHNGGTLCSNCCSNRHEHPQRGSTVDLRQLSFNLTRVEHQRSVP